MAVFLEKKRKHNKLLIINEATKIEIVKGNLNLLTFTNGAKSVARKERLIIEHCKNNTRKI